MDKNEKLVEIFENKQFLAAAEGAASAEELQKLFAEYGLELTVDEVSELCAQAVVCMKDGELNEADLEDVAGGVALVTIGIRAGINAIKWLVKNRRLKDLITLPALPRKPSLRR